MSDAIERANELICDEIENLFRETDRAFVELETKAFIYQQVALLRSSMTSSPVTKTEEA